MRSQSQFGDSILWMLAVAAAVALLVLLTTTPAWTQNAVPPTAREAASSPAFASRLAHQVRPEAAGKARASAPGRNRSVLPLDTWTYENGPVNGTTDAWTINFGYIVSDTFVPTSGVTVTGFDLNTWEFPGDILGQVDWSITSAPNGGTVYGSGTVKVTDTLISTNQYGYDIDKISATGLNVALNAGTFWFNLQNASVPSGDPVYWDENSGIGCNSPDCPSQAVQSVVGTIPSEAFDISGSTSGPPPPPCDGGDSTLVYSFVLPENAPQSITLDHAGNAYGPVGNRYSPESIFEWAKGVLTPLYNFAGGADGTGSTPLVVGPDGALYGGSDGGLQNCNGSYCGEVFKLRPPATVCTSALCPWVKTSLYQFTGVDAVGAPGNLVFDSAGDLYGTTIGDVKGGCTYGWGCGDVFKLTPSGGAWLESIIHSFSGSDGDEPSSLLIGKDGNLYGTTWYGGQYDSGTVFELTPSGTGWTETVLYNFQGQGYSGPGFLIQDSSSNLYGTFGQELFMLSPSNGSWVFTSLYVVDYDQDGWPYGLAISGGNLKGITRGPACGGSCDQPQLYNYGEIFELTPGDGGWNYSTLHTFNWWSPDYVTVAPNGYTLWGISWWGGKNCSGAIWRY